MTGCDCAAEAPGTAAERATLRIALALNAGMFVVEVAAGTLGHSSGLVADGLDMLADAAAYAIALAAIGRGVGFKARAATASGAILLLLGLGVLADAARRAVAGAAPDGLTMIVVAALALVVNAGVLRLLSRHRSDEVHLRATWIFTRADVIANAGVVVAGIGVLATGLRSLDLVAGAGIGLFVVREALEILRDARMSD